MANDGTTLKLDMRFGDYGVKHACVISKDTSEFQRGDTLDLVKYEKHGDGESEYNYVIGKWVSDREGYVFQSVGNRLFEDLDKYEISTVWPVLKSVQLFLDGLYYN